MTRSLRVPRLAAIGALGAMSSLFGVIADPAAAEDARTLSCEFDTAMTGQFKGLTYVGSPATNGVILTLVASASDAGAGRAVMIGGDRAAVVALIVQPHQTLFIDSGTADDTAVVSVFTGAAQSSDIPAAYSRQVMFGAIPILSQYTGLCHPQ